MADTIFSKMIRGEIKIDKIYEDDKTLAFLDQNPVTKGHTLVITKEPIDHLDDCSEETYQAVFRTVHKVSKQLRGKLKPKRIALVVHGLEIPHAHVHVVPLYTGKELTLADRGEMDPNNPKLKALAELLAL